MGVLATALAVALVLVASGVLFFLSDFGHRTAPAGRSHARPATAIATVAGLSAYSADDAAVWGPYNLMRSMTPTADPLDSSGLLITHDGGKSWLATGIGSTTADSTILPGGVSWTDSQDLAVVDNNSIWITSDGGHTWHESQMPVQPSPTADPFGTTFRVSGSAIFVISKPDRVYVTYDGGETWSGAVLPPPAGGSPADIGFFQLSGPFMFGSRGVLGAGDGVNTLIYTTSDGGKSWMGPITQRGQSLMALGPMDWWIVKSSGQVSRTLDGGNTWNTMPITPNYSVVKLTSIVPTGGNVFWAIANSALPLRSTDGGGHWSIVKLP
jgi:photosystem II stability/assembly factor-like uncharacterized protein